MRIGDRVRFEGRSGTIEGIMPQGMVDVRFDDRGEIERRSMGRLAKRNPRAITKIISGGQTGADQGGLDAAVDLGLRTGGWIPKGWKTENGPMPKLGRFGLKEHDSSRYPPRTEANVADSDGTLLFGDEKSRGARLTARIAKEAGKPLFVVPWTTGGVIPFAGAGSKFLTWLSDNNITILNVAGNRESGQPGIKQATRKFIVQALAKRLSLRFNPLWRYAILSGQKHEEFRDRKLLHSGQLGVTKVAGVREFKEKDVFLRLKGEREEGGYVYALSLDGTFRDIPRNSDGVPLSLDAKWLEFDSRTTSRSTPAKAKTTTKKAATTVRKKAAPVVKKASTRPPLTPRAALTFEQKVADLYSRVEEVADHSMMSVEGVSLRSKEEFSAGIQEATDSAATFAKIVKWEAATRSQKAYEKRRRTPQRPPKIQKAPSAKRKQQVGSFTARLPRISLHTREDRPRVNKKLDTYCGNPIDGTAYYVILSSDKRSSPPRYITRKEFEAAQGDRTIKETIALLKRRAKEEYGRSADIFEVSAIIADARAEQKGFRPKTGKKRQKGLRTEQLIGGFHGKTQRENIAPYGAYWYTNEAGEVRYLKQKHSVPNSYVFKRYSPYAFTSGSVGEGDPAGADRDGAAIAALRANHPEIHPATFEMLINTRMVKIGETRRDGELVKDRTEDWYGPGMVFNYWDKYKDESPFFSFVRVTHSPTAKNLPCLGKEDTEVIKALEEVASATIKFKSSLESVRGLVLDWLQGEQIPATTRPMRALTKILSAYTQLNRVKSGLDLAHEIPEENPAGAIAEKILMENGFEFPHQLDTFRAGVGEKGLRSKFFFDRSIKAEEKEKKIQENITELIAFAAIEGFTPMARTNYIRSMSGDFADRRERFDTYGIPFGMKQLIINKEEGRDQIAAIEAVVQHTPVSLGTLGVALFDREFRRAFYALIYTYYAVGGYEFAGPLSPKKRTPRTSVLQEDVNAIRKILGNMQGGERGLTGTGQQVFMTYNPLLFKVFSQTADAQFNVLSEPYLLREIDAVGRYGEMLKLVQLASMTHNTLMRDSLEDEVYPPRRIDRQAMQRDRTDGGKSQHEAFLLLWPLGATKAEAYESIEDFLTDPLKVIRHLKVSVSRAIGQAARHKWFGVRTVEEVDSIDYEEELRTFPENKRKGEKITLPYPYDPEKKEIERSALSKAGITGAHLRILLAKVDLWLENHPGQGT